jgi:hypothetical protein
MKKFRRQIENIDKFIEALEEMIDARDDMWQEELHHNWKQQDDIRTARYEPARARLKEALTDHIVEVVEDED